MSRFLLKIGEGAFQSSAYPGLPLRMARIQGQARVGTARTVIGTAIVGKESGPFLRKVQKERGCRAKPEWLVPIAFCAISKGGSRLIGGGCKKLSRCKGGAAGER